jgi:hypothetical protein
MKKTRLLEIVREEIGFALNEAGLGDQITALDKQIEAGTKQMTPIQKKVADLQKKKADLQKKEADLASKSQSQLEENTLNEIEQLAEMASIVQLKTQLEKQGKNAELNAVKAAEKATIDKLKQNPVFSGEGKNARLKGYVSALKKELKAEHDINLQDLLTTVMLDAEKAGDKFKDDIATNTIEKDAAAQVLGTEKGQRGRKADPNKPEKAPSTGQKGRPAGTAKEKVATRTPGDDGFDTVTYSDKEDEEGPSAQDISGDETAKELSNIPADKKDKFNLGLKFINKYKDDKPKIDAYLKKAKDEYKLPKTMMDDLKRAAGRGVE